MTGHTTFGEETDILAEGADKILKKPVRLSDMANLLASYRCRPSGNDGL